MKQWLKNIFYVPKHMKPTDENILQLLMPSFAGIIVCMIFLAGSTWAWFSASISTTPQTITAADYDIEVSITDQDGEPVALTEQLTENTEYKITLTASGTAKQFGGYCIIKGGDTTLYTGQVFPNETKTFTFTPKETAEYTFASVWGKYSGDADIIPWDDTTEQTQTETTEQQSALPSENVEELVEQQPASPIEDAEETSTVYVVKSGDTLWDIAKAYNITVEEIAACNDIETSAVLHIGQELQIPTGDFVTEDGAATENESH